MITIEAIQKEASQLLTQESVQIETLVHFIGTIVATKPAIPLGALHFHALQDLKTQALHCGPTMHLPIIGSAVSTSTQGSTVVNNSTAVALLNVNLEDRGFHCHGIRCIPLGAVCQGVHIGGRWTPSELAFHINYLELKGAFLALQSFVKDMSNTYIGVLIRMDNRTATAYVNKMGGHTISAMSFGIADLGMVPGSQHYPHAAYLPGKNIAKTDWESHHHRDSRIGSCHHQCSSASTAYLVPLV